MASLSLPRVLQLKKNSLDAEREQFEKFQTLAIQKAINSIETPVKEKHVRSTIIGTFQEQSAVTYWMVAIRLPLQDNRIAAWKFCNVTHKLLREGHPACLDDSQRHISMIENLGKLWVHLREGYGRLIHLYCSLLVCKLKFHARNPRFPGHMQLSADELDAIAENDVNNYFQICVELFDYMDEILDLQAAVFDSLGNARANSMTASGQCRLAALIPCAQDASHIYDCNVRLLFRLHASLPGDVLQGHRDRFRQQFKKLSAFYKHASSLQYYRNLLSLPVLPANPPNFLIQSDFGTYVTPVVSVPEPPPDEVDAVGSLIDTSDTFSQATTPDNFDAFDTRTTPSPQPDPLIERDRLIEHLQSELKRMRSEVTQMSEERSTMVASMREHCTRIETQLEAAKAELDEEKRKVETLSVVTPEIQQKLTATEEKARITDEKFQKLKGAYTQLREEHINLIRQKAEVDKMAASLRAAAAQHESVKSALQQQLNDKIKDVELLQQSASSSDEIEAYKSEIANLRTELEQSRSKESELETLRASMEAIEIEHKTVSTEQQNKISHFTNELKEVVENLEIIKKEKEERESELTKVKEELIKLQEKSCDEYKKVLREKEEALKEVEELTKLRQQEKEDQLMFINTLQNDKLILNQQLNDANENFKEKYDEVYSKLQDVNSALNKKNFELEELKLGYENNIFAQAEEMAKIQNDLHNLQQQCREKSKLIEDLQEEKSGNQLKLLELISEQNNLKGMIAEKQSEISSVENAKSDINNTLKEKEEEITMLYTKMQDIVESKQELVSNLTSIIAGKDQRIITLSLELNYSNQNLNKTEEDLKETRKELEAATDKLLVIKREYETNVVINDDNMKQKNDEICSLQKQIDDIIEKNTLLDQDKKVLEQDIEALRVSNERLNMECENLQREMISAEKKYDDGMAKLRSELKQLEDAKEQAVSTLLNKNSQTVKDFEEIINQKDAIILEKEILFTKLQTKLNDLELVKAKEFEDIDFVIIQKENENKMLDMRLNHTERERLTAECELQDLLQHNTVLEADLAAAKRQLEEAQRLIDEQKLKIVSCVSEAALQVTDEALLSLDRANAQESNKMAAEIAAKALEDLARQREVKGNEENMTRSAILAAHNAAQLSAYVTEVANGSTDMELSDRLTSECRSMLTTTKKCLESIKTGTIEGSKCLEARRHTQNVCAAAAKADNSNSGPKSVDDELAEMDTAIEQAASQIEEMLAASRKGDSGVKLEVNEKILDACTTLMGAVKILVQDARKLQNELGDHKTRQKMYMRNPQWSEGLISAAKAVVFAAKLLVTSADEAVGAAGRVEGVSAAAHEVAGSTAQLVAASRARAPPTSPSLARLTQASRSVAAATGAVVAAVRAGSQLVHEQDALDTSALTLTATRRLEMESKVRSLELECALDAERTRLAALRKRHYQLAQLEENGNLTNGKQ